MQDRCPICHQFTELCDPQPDALDYCTACGSILRTRRSATLRRLDGQPLCLIEPVARAAAVPARRAPGNFIEPDAPSDLDAGALLDPPADFSHLDDLPRPLLDPPAAVDRPHRADTRLVPLLMFISSVALGVLVTCGWYVLVQGIVRLARH